MRLQSTSGSMYFGILSILYLRPHMLYSICILIEKIGGNYNYRILDLLHMFESNV